MLAFDEREVGYRRVALPLSALLLPPPSGPSSPSGGRSQSVTGLGPVLPDTPLDVALLAALEHSQQQCSSAAGAGGCTVRAWIYVPQSPIPANGEYPICQTYLDVVIRGYLNWGGQGMARAFVEQTEGWSQYFLNDAPLSRRPWLHREQFKAIDEILEAYASLTLLHERRHPEAFAASFLSSLHGMWGVPQRNRNFVGRDLELRRIEASFDADRGPGGEEGGITQIATVGLGGVGKTQIAIEYCHRSYQRRYGLIVWLRAEHSEAMAADIRKLAIDVGMEVKDKTLEDVVEEVKSRMYRTRCPWLLVLDNVDDPESIAKFIPRGGIVGHVLVTSRVVVGRVSR